MCAQGANLLPDTVPDCQVQAQQLAILDATDTAEARLYRPWTRCSSCRPRALASYQNRLDRDIVSHQKTARVPTTRLLLCHAGIRISALFVSSVPGCIRIPWLTTPEPSFSGLRNSELTRDVHLPPWRTLEHICYRDEQRNPRSGEVLAPGRGVRGRKSSDPVVGCESLKDVVVRE